MTPCRSRLSSALCLLSLAFVAAHARAADPEPSMRAANERRAACVAALTTKAEPLVARLKAGDGSVKPELLGLTESGFALIGVAYQDGLRKPEADQMLAAAKQAQKTMPADELSALQATCRAAGSKVLSQASMFERFLVTSAAQRRVNRIIESAHKAAP